MLLFAVAVGILGLFMGVTFDSVTALGGAVGGWLTWRAVAGLFGAVYALTPPLGLAFLGAVVAVGGVVGAPILGERLL